MQKSYIIITSATAAALILGTIIITNKRDTHQQNPAPTSSSTQSTLMQSNSNKSAQKESAATITYTNSGFSPSKVTVKSGDQITIKNDSSQALEFSSDPHPVHTDNPELNQDVLEPGQSRSFTVTTKGTWGYHDHLNEANSGSVVVE